MASFTYKDSLERARKAVLDSRSKFAVPDSKETLKTVSEGLMRPRARPEKEPVEDTSLYSVGNALMEALMPEAPTESPRPQARPEGNEGPRRPVARDGDDVYLGLVDRGLPKHVAKGFVMNFRDESGLDTGINEANPLVEGSRGGYGLYQVTGPRRVAYEAFAKKQGKPLDDLDAQLDFLMVELGSTESSASKKIMATGTAGEAASAIVNSFLRPAAEHRERRSARYLSQNL
tara:strand:- start:232 stop:927 length:696 start_codon:yes stop_codon:yes gene_type:complete